MYSVSITNRDTDEIRTLPIDREWDGPFGLEEYDWAWGDHAPDRARHTFFQMAGSSDKVGGWKGTRYHVAIHDAGGSLLYEDPTYNPPDLLAFAKRLLSKAAATAR